MNKKRKILLTTAIVATLGIGGLVASHHKKAPDQDAATALGLTGQETLFGDFKAPAQASLPASSTQAQTAAASSPVAVASQPPVSPSPGSEPPPFAKKAQGFAKVNNVGSNVAQAAFDKGDYKTAIIAQYEGYRGQYYPDNKGYAIGYGFNAKFHTRAMMETLGRPLIPDPAQLAGFASQAEQDALQPQARSVNLTPEQAASLVQGVLPQYDAPAVKALCGPSASVTAPCALYENLKPNEKAALMYNNYKRGSIPSDLKSPLLTYAKSPTPENKKAVLAHISYSYVSRAGQRIQDTRGTAGVQAMFDSPEAFAALLGKNPTYVSTHNLSSELPALASVKIDPAKSIDEQIPDPVGIAKEQAVEQGLHFDYQPIEIAKPDAPARAPLNRSVGRMPSGWL